ncbi:hypothetical protein LAZ67_10001127 [Cordylochernes scorpioides]|uniref:Uncharacterized protein n=1 Tax=Cordylochernes scorpioides TaxID=51811 RepID=A0ABY6KW59_9ARAC|nr:hypothetical protein LAZ67_10001127 [Cordylochernes scorpioides]
MFVDQHLSKNKNSGNGHVCATFREACQKLNLLENDAHGIFYSLMLLIQLNRHILHRKRRINANPNIQFTSNIYNEALILIEDVCLTIANISLTELGIIAPNISCNDIFDRDIQRETHFDVNDSQTFVRINLSKLVLEQRHNSKCNI